MNKLSFWLRAHWMVSLLVLGIMTGGYYYFRSDTASETAVVQTKGETAHKGDIRIIVSGSGQIQADSQIDLKPVAAGDAIQVMAVFVKNDQEVKKGQIIATLDSKDAVRNVREAELSLKSAKIKMQQTGEDFNNKNTSDTLARRAQETSVKQQELALEEALSKLSDYTIRAPFDGIVTGLSVDGGDTISQTTILASIITKSMKAVISLNEVDAVKVKVGKAASLSFDALPNIAIGGKVSKIDTIGVAVQGVVSYGAEITLDEQHASLKPGMTVAAEISVEEKKNILLISNAALSYENGKAYAVTAPNRQLGSGTIENQNNQIQRGQRKEIEIGITDNVNTEIVSGLSEGERVLIATSNTSAIGSVSVTAGRQGQSQGGIFNIFRSGNRGGNTSR
ncbi:MAG: efflux RND transporter periplasmic adaptor subunit [bacterium]|nr:efflux RND transporter periplasmic adaptor subunit [bacterium]